jgi:putative toxin-antitoxin system antitoxin component (TIGR02293 family)
MPEASTTPRRARPTPEAPDILTDMRRLIASEDRYQKLHSCSPIDRIGIVKQGLPARLLVTLANDMRIPREQLYGWLGLPRATANRKVKADQALGRDESEGALAIARLVGQVAQIVAESGEFSESAGFDVARWTAEWLEEPNAALGGKSPGDFMDTADGRGLVSGLVAQMQSGAYA